MADAVELYSQQLSAALSSLAGTPGRFHTSAESSLDTSGPNVAATTAAAFGAVQVISQVPLIWNWSPTASGTMDRALFDFCDTIPGSNTDGAPFFSGTDSFSGNYCDFVQSISSADEFSNLVKHALDRATEPAEDAVNTPDGWARVAVNNINQWKPVWSPQLSTNDWLIAVAGADPAPRTIEFNFTGADGSTHNEEAPASLHALLGDAIRKVSITSRAWGRIGITPGAWFSSSVVTLAARGTAFKPWKPEDLFGPQGLLRYRISEFFVAASPQISISVPHDSVGIVTEFLSGVEQFVVGGMAFSGGTGSVPPANRPQVTTDASGTTIAGTSASAHPQIVAVIVTPTAVPFATT